MNMIRAAILLVFVTALAFSQTRPEFEVASIRPSAEQIGQANIGLHIDGAQVRCVYLSLKEYIGIAYKLKTYQIKGPDWLASTRFDISAKLPDGATSAQVGEMLQNLLADRFKLKLHHASEDFPVYSLEVAKGGLKMAASTVTPDADSSDKSTVNIAATGNSDGVGISLGKGAYVRLGDNKFEGKGVTMTSFADSFARFVDRPIVDATNMKGTYDFVFEVSPEDYRALLIRSAINAGVTLPPQALRALDFSTGDSLTNALQKAGLQLTPGKAPLDVVVIDSMLKAPAEN